MSLNEQISNTSIVSSCTFLAVWCVKYRRKVLTGKIEDRLKELVATTCEDMGVSILDMEIYPGHVYLLLKIDPQCGVHKTVKQIKRITSRFLRQEFPELCSKLPTLWTNSYYTCTVGEISSDDIQQYIDSQTTSSRQEFPKKKGEE